MNLFNWLSCFNSCFSGSGIRITLDAETPLTSDDSFNPCFSGSGIRICLLVLLLYFFLHVSILVLVDLAFECFFCGHCVTSFKVSILVLVDLAFECLKVQQLPVRYLRFNPCFSGSCIRIFPTFFLLGYTLRCFNPCFSGSCIRIDYYYPCERE